MSPITDAVIPVGGLGTRLLPATRSQPKEMLPLVDRPVVQYVVEELVEAGVQRVLFVTGRRKRAIEDHFDADPELGAAPLIDPRTGLRILYTRQARPAGLGDALRYAEGIAGQEGIVVALGDSIIEPGGTRGIVRRLIEAYETGEVAATVAVSEVAEEAVSRYGVVVAAEDGTVLEVVEKPAPEATPSRTAVMGRYILGPSVFAALRRTEPDASGEVQLTDALNRVIAEGSRVVAVPLGAEERRIDIGTIESYCGAFVERALSHPIHGAALRRRIAALLDERG